MDKKLVVGQTVKFQAELQKPTDENQTSGVITALGQYITVF